MGRHVVYGEGGLDPSKPNNNIVDEYEVPDNLEPFMDAQAVVNAVRDPDLPTPSLEERVAAIEQLLIPQEVPL